MSEDKNIIKEQEKNNIFSKEETEEVFGNIINTLSNNNGGEEGVQAIASLLALPDELFEVVSEAVILELEKQLNDSNAKLAMALALQSEGINTDNIEKVTEQILLSIDDELKEIPKNKRDFLKRVVTTGINMVSDSFGTAKKNVSIPIELCHEDAKMPSYANDTDAGMDVYALEDITINPGETVLVKTGLKVAIPVGYELQVRPKSGRALKTKLRVANTPGTIDSGYRDEIGVIIENIEHPIQDIEYEFDEHGTPIIKSILHGKSYTINKGDKFAQLVLNEVPHVAFYEVNNINEIEGDRGGGFGSTGLK